MKKYVLFGLIFTLLITLFSCRGENDSMAFSKESTIDTLKVNVGFPSIMASFQYKEKNYISFYDLVTYKKLSVYSEDLKLLKTYSLENLGNTEYNFTEIQMISPDSALLFTDYNTNVLMGINFKTGKAKQVYLNNIVQFGKKNMAVEFWPNEMGSFLFKNRIVLTVTPGLESLKKNHSDLSFIDFLKKFDTVCYDLPHYVLISHPFDSLPKVKFIKKSSKYIQDFRNAKQVNMGITFFGSNEMIYSNHFTNYFEIFKLDGSSSQKEKKSKFTDIVASKISWKEIEKNSIALDNINTNYRDAGKVLGAFFNAKKNQYNVFVVYSKKRNPDPNGEVTPFIWQVYDKNFNLLNEKEMAPTNLMVNTVVPTKNHVYFTYYNENTYDPNIKILVRYSL